MKFDLKYPNLAPGTILSNHEDFTLRSKEIEPCCQCKEPTAWVDISFESPICSEECTRVMWDEYHEACRLPPGVDPDV